MPAAPELGNIDLVSAVVLIGGEAISDAIQIQRIETVKHVNRIPYAILTFLDGSVAQETFKHSEADTFVPGNAVEIKLGYHDSDASVFKGVIVKHAVQVTRARECRLVVTCSDKAVAMTTVRNRGQFLGKSDDAALKSLIESHGLTADVARLGGEHEQMVQYFASDWDYLVCRAEANGALVIADGGAVSVKPPAFDSPALSFGFGLTVIDVDIEMDARSQYEKVEAQTWDPAAQALTSQTASEPSWSGQGNISGATLAKVLKSASGLQSAGLPTGDGLKTWADASLLKSRLARIRGRAAIVGNGQLQPGQMVELDGLGARFDGNAFVSGVRHSVDGGVWRTEVSFGLPNAWFGQPPDLIGPPPAGGLVPAAQGLQIGKVKQIHDDPAGQRRVKVSIPLLATDDDAIWMRLASPYATSGAGVYFMPEIDDEVVVGFLNGDPAAPVVIGSLHSGARKAPYVPDQKNETKAVVTNSQLKLIFDDEKKFIRAETPGGHYVLINDEDASITIKDTTGNKMLMNKSGIALTSPGDITITATGAMKITGDAGVTIHSPADVKISGLNASMTADLKLSAQAQVQAELKAAAGEVTIQGLVVMIN
jgi:Rhs element Vgr protein